MEYFGNCITWLRGRHYAAETLQADQSCRWGWKQTSVRIASAHQAPITWRSAVIAIRADRAYGLAKLG